MSRWPACPGRGRPRNGTGWLSCGSILLEERTELLLAMGRQHEAIPDLLGLTRAHPQRERFLSQLMVALYRATGGPTRWPSSTPPTGYAASPARACAACACRS